MYLLIFTKKGSDIIERGAKNNGRVKNTEPAYKVRLIL